MARLKYNLVNSTHITMMIGIITAKGIQLPIKIQSNIDVTSAKETKQEYILKF